MTDDPIKRSIAALIMVCTVVLMICAVYYLAEYRAHAKATAAAANRFGAPPAAFAREPLEGGGIEGIMTQEGLLVTTVDRGGQALGVRVGDTIRSVGGQPLMHPAQLRRLAPGTTLEAVRGGQRFQTVVQATAAPMRQAGAGGPAGAAEVRTLDVRGLDGRLTADGLWVNTLDGGAATWGLRPGDLIRTIDGQPLNVRRDARTLIRNLDPAAGGMFEIVRNGALVFVPLGGAGANTAAKAGQQAMLPPPQAQPDAMAWGGGTWWQGAQLPPGGATALPATAFGR